MSLTQKLLAGGWLTHVEWPEELGSTQDRARELTLDGGVKLPFLIGAERQTAGRGRGAHRWWTGHGALAVSLVLDPTEFAARDDLPPQFALAVGVALAQTVKSIVPAHAVGLHWPNDVYLDERKLAGILTESVAPRKVIVGVGLNSNNTLDEAPPELRARAVTLRDLTGREFDHAEFLLRWFEELRAAIMLLYVDPDGLAREFQSLCIQVGRTIRLNQGDRTFTGRCLGIAPDGALLLECESGVRAFHTGTSSDENVY